jgi:poly-gamma-glutamate system protein
MKPIRPTQKIIAAGLASLLVYIAMATSTAPRESVPPATNAEAARLMRRAIDIVAARRAKMQFPEDPSLDPNRTGLIGAETGDLLTTTGDLDAKRTTTNPNMAALIAHLLREAGVTRGQTIGIACSGSFPALMLASIAAAKAAGARPAVILSLGASSYGATDARFSLLDVYAALLEAGFCNDPPAAVSLGGEKDQGLEFEPSVRDALVHRIEGTRIPFIRESDLQKNVALRWTAYESRGGPIAALINCGGSYSSLGTNPYVLQLKPGLVSDVAVSSPSQRGLVQETAARHIPVIHLLHIKGLALRYGLPWDPVPLPEPAAFSPPAPQHRQTGFRLISVSYLVLLLALVFWPGTPRNGDTEFH